MENDLPSKYYCDIENTLKPKSLLSSSLIPLKSVNLINNDSFCTTDDDTESVISNGSFYSNNGILNKNSSYVSNILDDNNLLVNDSFVSTTSNLSYSNPNSEVIIINKNYLIFIYK